MQSTDLESVSVDSLDKSVLEEKERYRIVFGS